MCIEFVIQVPKEKNAHVSFPVGMVQGKIVNINTAEKYRSSLFGVSLARFCQMFTHVLPCMWGLGFLAYFWSVSLAATFLLGIASLLLTF